MGLAWVAWPAGLVIVQSARAFIINITCERIVGSAKKEYYSVLGFDSICGPAISAMIHFGSAGAIFGFDNDKNATNMECVTDVFACRTNG